MSLGRQVKKGRRGVETHLVFDIFETDWEIDGETDKDDVRFRVRQRSQSIILSVR